VLVGDSTENLPRIPRIEPIWATYSCHSRLATLANTLWGDYLKPVAGFCHDQLPTLHRETAGLGIPVSDAVQRGTDFEQELAQPLLEGGRQGARRGPVAPAGQLQRKRLISDWRSMRISFFEVPGSARVPGTFDQRL